MITFLIGIAILVVGGSFYGRFCEKVFQPDDRKTPAYAKNDGVDYVPMPKWKNSLINLLNIAGTGPILGPIQGVLFGPIALITIPIGCVIGGAMHDFFCGMICIRDGGTQMPDMIGKYTNKHIYRLYTIFVSIVLFLVGVVFIYTPGDIAATQVFGYGGTPQEASTWVIYSVIFVYYLIATIFPIDKIIGKIYPIFGAILLLSAVGIFVMLLTKGVNIPEIWKPWVAGGFDFGAYFKSGFFIPNFFVTVACGILSGFHSTQTALISRTIKSEREGRATFYNMMLTEGFIALVWAAATLVMISIGAEHAGITMQMTDAGWGYFMQGADGLQQISATSVVGVICRNMLGPIGGAFALVGVIVLPITSGDTALRAFRLMLADIFKLKLETPIKRILFAVPIFAIVYICLILAKMNAAGFNVIWRYFGWSNQTMAIFALSCIVIYLMGVGKKKFIWMPMIPLVFYSFVTTSYIFSTQVGFALPMPVAYTIGAVFTLVVVVATIIRGSKGNEACAAGEVAEEN
ncbi:MAG: carbon starvation protein A [Pseudobutyrivibrio sp.]|nr:carbon starvation protein A [Pseudobutyrivibrio sp.]